MSNPKVFVLSFNGSTYTSEIGPRMKKANVPEYNIVLNSVDQSRKGFLENLLYLLGTNYISFKVEAGRRQRSKTTYVALKYAWVAMVQVSTQVRKKKRNALRAQVAKSKAVMRGQILMLGQFLETQAEVALFLEDDFDPQADLYQRVQLILSNIPNEGAFGIEISDSFSISELGITAQHIEFRVAVGLSEILRINPGSSNTTCATVYNRAGATVIRDEIRRLTQSSWIQAVPVDLLISYIYLQKHAGITNYHVVPGLVRQLSDFRRPSWHQS